MFFSVVGTFLYVSEAIVMIDAHANYPIFLLLISLLYINLLPLLQEWQNVSVPEHQKIFPRKRPKC